MVSVCMSVKNGSKYLEEQVTSILPQLGTMDELVACDNGSTDDTVSLLRSFKDPRIKIINASDVGIIGSFEHALMSCSGELIYLADQDDIWSPNKISTMS